MNKQVKPIAFYLPQYHEIKENNEWWGEGFTEWTNVKKARPKFANHHQPHVPLGQNYYDLSDPRVLESQAKLAQAYGVHAFCFYHYWFNGDLLLEKPLHNLLNNKTPDFPFCLCWANENWTRTWDGQEKEVLKKQNYSLDDDLAHISYLLPFFKDERYLKIEGKPVFLMYRTELHPNINEASEIWRNEAKKAGFPDLFLIRVENFERNIDPMLHGFDAGTEFAPDGAYSGKKANKKNMLTYILTKALHKTGIKRSAKFTNKVFSYPTLVNNMINKEKPSYKYFRCISPAWDNSARRKENSTIYVDTNPQLFGEWAKKMVAYTRINLPKNEQFLFVNAWNEWGEGCHLEPDEKMGTVYLEELEKAIK